jgi:hypothetical protein
VEFLRKHFEKLVHLNIRVAFDLLVGLGSPRRFSGRPWGGASGTGGCRAVKADASGSGLLPLGTALGTIRLVERLKGPNRI